VGSQPAGGSEPYERRVYSLVLLVLTLAYLSLELAFNARLLDVASNPADTKGVDGIEHWGRIITGLAASLALWGAVIPLMLRRGASLIALSMVLGAVTIGTTTATFYGLRAFYDWKAETGSTAAQRQAAAWATIVSSHVYDGAATLDGLRLSRDDLETPAGKAFFALLARLYMPISKSEGTLQAVVPEIVRQLVRKEIGAPSDTYRSGYLECLRRTQTTYNDRYLPAADEYAKGRSELAGVPQAYRAEYTKRLEADWKKGSAGIVESGQTLSPNLQTFAAFIDAPPVQSLLRQCVGAPSGTPNITNRWNESMWTQYVYTPRVEEEVAARIRSLYRDRESFEPGGKHYCLGISAIHSVTVPETALLLSLLGATFHSSKCFWLLLYAAPLALRLGLIGAYLGCLLLLTLAQANPIVTSDQFGVLLANITFDERGGMRGVYAAPLVDGVIRAQQAIYPASETIRHYLYNDIEFHHTPTEAHCKDKAS
jgi:hypothetical protein